jgi:heme-degrading monooxygenase HmoA
VNKLNYVVANRIFVEPHYSHEFEHRFQTRAGQINQQPGFILMEILKPQSADTPYVVMTHWENEQAFRNWVGSEDFKLAHQNPMPKDAFREGGGIEQYEVIISSNREPSKGR